MELHKDFIKDITNAISLFENGTVIISDNIRHSARQTIRQITHYILSEYMNGNIDEQGRRKGFRNIGNAIVDIEWRATNIDRKNIVPRATDDDHVFAMVVREELRNWMKENNFGEIIDNIRRKEIEYGSVIVKKTVNDGVLKIEELDFENVIFDALDLDEGVKIETSYLSPYQLNKKRGIWENIDEAIESADKNREDDNDSTDNRVKVLDIQGYFPAVYFDEEADEGVYKLYNVILTESDGEYLYHWHDEVESNYKVHSRKSAPQRALGLGVWEELFEEQIGINEAVIQEKIAQDYAGRVIPRTNKQDLPGNASDFEDGQIIFLDDGEYFDTVVLNPGNMPEYQRQMDNWFLNAQRRTSTYNAISGEEQKSGTPFAAQALQSAQGGSIFDKRRDRFGFFLREIIIDWVLPFIVKKINAEHELTAAYSPKELEMIDSAMGRKKEMEMVLNGELVTPEKQNQISDVLNKKNILAGKQRTLKIPKGYITMDKIKKKIVIDITGEMGDEQKKINSITAVLQTLAPDDPKRMDLITELMELSDINSYGIKSAPDAPKQISQGGTAKTLEQALPAGQA